MADDMLEQEEISPAEQRIKDLSAKVKLTSTERDELKAAKEQSDAEKAAALKEVEFYKGFNTMTSKYQGAGEFQDKIKEKVMAGYDMEDATVSILNREGKLNSPISEPARPKDSPAGGSAATTLRSNEKTFSEMDRSERRQALADLEREDGSISRLLNGNLP